MNKKGFSINSFDIHEHREVFIIAEAGVNHNGDLDKALHLVDVAKEAGAHAVKFQTFRPEDVVIDQGPRNMLTPLVLNEEYYPTIMAHCKKQNILFLSTPHGGKRSVDFLEGLGVPAYKIGSGDLTNYILLKRVAQTGKPIILSTGMSTLTEVKRTVVYIRSHGNKELAILHATTSYPCPPSDVNLRAMVTLMQAFDIPVGFSDHTNSDEAAIAAAALGMAVYECHLTLNKKLPGPDHKASCTPSELAKRIHAIKMIQIILGTKEKVPTAIETDSMRSAVRRSLVYTKDHQAGHVLTDNDLEAKRPGDGISAIHFEQFIGKKLKTSVKKDQQVQYEDFTN